MLCRWCGTDMPDGSQFCLKCGQKTDGAAIKALPAATPSQLSCVSCGTSLAPTAAFCLKCGRPAPSTGNLEALATVLAECMAFLRARRQRRILVWSFLLVLLGAVLWAVTGESPAAREVQEFVHWSQAQTIVDASVSVNPRSFSSHEFTVPPGALDVTVTGEFSASPECKGPRQWDRSLCADQPCLCGVEHWLLHGDHLPNQFDKRRRDRCFPPRCRSLRSGVQQQDVTVS
jgi:hypothetical protein